MNTSYAKWQKLCEKLESAKDAHFEAQAVVTYKFTQIAKGLSNDNPTEEELSKADSTSETQEKIRKQMESFFIRPNT